MQGLDLDYMLGLVPVILGYVPLTLGMAAAAMVLALILAALLAVERVFRVAWLDWAVVLFISFFRGTPLLVQLFLFYYGLPQVLSVLTNIDGVTAAIMGLTLHFSAYMAETIRAAILGVDLSQWEAAQSIGMTQAQMMRRIILPQMLVPITAPLTNFIIILSKETAILSVVTVPELLYETQTMASETFTYVEPFLVLSLFYWLMVIATSWLGGRVEARVAHVAAL